jgi:hydroxymethylbilane synthase
MDLLKIATRSSPLAMWQAHFVAQKLREAGFETELIPLETLGDKKLEVSLSKIGDKGVFTQELEQLLFLGEAHLAVHSAKDLPSRLPDGLEIIAFTEREVPIDVVVSDKPDFHLENKKLKIGTASTRRVATLARYFPEIETVAVRGNLQTRIRKMQEGACDALLLAFAGIHRMGFIDLIQQELDFEIFTPAVGQGALAIEASTELSEELKSRIQLALGDQETKICLEAERAFLREMDGGCSVPVFGHAWKQNSILHLMGGIISLDGKEEIRETIRIQWPEPEGHQHKEMGVFLARQVLDAGGASILSKIKQTLRQS